MPTSEAMIGYSSTVEVSTDGGSNWTTIAEVSDLTPPPISIDSVDVTHLTSPNRAREFIAGLQDRGETTFTINWVVGSASDVLLRSIAVGFTTFMIRETFPNGAYWTMSGILTGYAPSAPLDDKMSAEVTIKVTSVVTHNAAAAPVNSLLPAISGTAEVGEVLYAWPGQWTGGPTFAFQWKNEGVNINGATSQTYTLQASDEGDNITVTVTATNSAGSTSATSEETVAVAA
jgi:predicted secreted protein